MEYRILNFESSISVFDQVYHDPVFVFPLSCSILSGIFLRTSPTSAARQSAYFTCFLTLTYELPACPPGQSFPSGCSPVGFSVTGLDRS